MKMKLLSILLFATTLSDTLGFASLLQATKCRSVSVAFTQLSATQAETEAERLLRKARELREARKEQDPYFAHQNWEERGMAEEFCYWCYNR